MEHSLKKVVKLLFLAVGLIAAMLLYFVLVPNLFPRGSSPQDTEEAWRRGEVVRREIEQWKAKYGDYPDSLRQLMLANPCLIYQKPAPNNFSISVRMKGRREFMTYFHGPLSQKSGWYHSGYGIDGIKQLSSQPYKK
jgi:hypothetical protein